MGAQGKIVILCFNLEPYSPAYSLASILLCLVVSQNLSKQLERQDHAVNAILSPCSRTHLVTRRLMAYCHHAADKILVLQWIPTTLASHCPPAPTLEQAIHHFYLPANGNICTNLYSLLTFDLTSTYPVCLCSSQEDLHTHH